MFLVNHAFTRVTPLFFIILVVSLGLWAGSLFLWADCKRAVQLQEPPCSGKNSILTAHKEAEGD